jgi:D-alanine-D-alanine ligase-like ATP-grasp enzyme
MNRADSYLRGTEGEGELVSLAVNARPGPTATSLLPERAAQVEGSLNWPGARMVENGSCKG